MTYDKNEYSKNKAQASDQDADLEAVVNKLDEFLCGSNADDGGNSAGDQDCRDDEFVREYPERVVSRTVCINFPPASSVCHYSSGIEVSVHDILTWFAAARPDMASRLIAIRDGFFSECEEDFDGATICDGNWMPEELEERAEIRVAHANGEAERLARRAAIEAEFAQHDAETARRDAEIAIMWTPFAEEHAKLKNEEEALVNRADELDRLWEQFVIERETWGDDRAAREDARRAELTEESDALIADQAACWGRWRELLPRVAEAWAKRQSE